MKLISTLPKRTGFLYSAPLLDVVLLLLIFFLLGSNFTLRSGVSVTMPYSDSSMPVVERSHVIVVSPGHGARIDFNEERVTIEELAERLADENKEVRQVILLADERAEYGTVATISNMVLQNDFELFFGMNQPVDE